jgi:hypothetical protein
MSSAACKEFTLPFAAKWTFLRHSLNQLHAMTTSPISIRQINPATERFSVDRLLKEYLPEAATDGRFDWAYLDNPDGVAYVWLAETADGNAIGTSAAFPRQFQVKGNTVRALVLSDFVIDSRFRTLGPAVALLRATLASIDDGLYDFALDHPSDSMMAVYKRLGGTELGRRTRYVRLLKTSGAAHRRWGTGLGSSILGSLGDFALRTVDRFRRVPDSLTTETHSGDFGREFATLGGVLGERRAIFGDRSLDYLNWRYRSANRFTHVTVAVRLEGKLLAYSILQQTDAMSLVIVELVCPADAAIEMAIFHAILAVSHRRNVESLQASCMEGDAWCTILRRLGFVEREQSAGPVVYSPKGAKWADILTDRDQWWMTDGDRDG